MISAPFCGGALPASYLSLFFTLYSPTGLSATDAQSGTGGTIYANHQNQIRFMQFQLNITGESHELPALLSAIAGTSGEVLTLQADLRTSAGETKEAVTDTPEPEQPAKPRKPRTPRVEPSVPAPAQPEVPAAIEPEIPGTETSEAEELPVWHEPANAAQSTVPLPANITLEMVRERCAGLAQSGKKAAVSNLLRKYVPAPSNPDGDPRLTEVEKSKYPALYADLQQIQ